MEGKQNTADSIRALHECFHVTFANFIFSHPKYYKYALPLVFNFTNNEREISIPHFAECGIKNFEIIVSERVPVIPIIHEQ